MQHGAGGCEVTGVTYEATKERKAGSGESDGAREFKSGGESGSGAAPRAAGVA